MNRNPIFQTNLVTKPPKFLYSMYPVFENNRYSVIQFPKRLKDKKWQFPFCLEELPIFIKRNQDGCEVRMKRN